MKKKWLFLFCLLVAISSMAQNSYQPNWESLDKRPVPAWFENAKFGIFEPRRNRTLVKRFPVRLIAVLSH